MCINIHTPTPANIITCTIFRNNYVIQYINHTQHKYITKIADNNQIFDSIYYFNGICFTFRNRQSMYKKKQKKNQTLLISNKVTPVNNVKIQQFNYSSFKLIWNRGK